MTIEMLNTIDEAVLDQELEKCCGSSAWIQQMSSLRPFQNKEDFFTKASQVWKATTEKDWLEAFSHHPKIGDLKSLEKKFASTRELAGSEQGSVQTAAHKTLEELAKGNQEYEKKFGFIFIVCATGKTAEEMLAILKSRIQNNRETELIIAAGEQFKITTLRLNKFLS